MVDIPWNDLEVATKSTVMQAAKQFAEAFAETRQFLAFEQAHFAYRQDDQAQSARQEFQKKQASLKALLMLNAVSGEDRQELERLKDQFNNQPSVVQYTKAKDELVSISQEIGDLLTKAIGMDYGNSCRTGGCRG